MELPLATGDGESRARLLKLLGYSYLISDRLVAAESAYRHAVVLAPGDREVMLGLAGKGGGELEGTGHDRGWGRDGVEMGVQKAQEGGGIAGGFGEVQVPEVEVAIVEGEGETGRDGRALGGGESRAEGVEVAVQKEEEGLETLKGMLEIPGDLKNYGIGDDEIEWIISESLPSGSLKMNPRPTTADDLRAILAPLI